MITGAGQARLGIHPAQVPPVRRPELVHPHQVVDVVHGTVEELIARRVRLMHGANFNDPQRFIEPSYERMKYSIQTL
jgi:cyanobactin biosynthesis protein (PatB/AcyB/McaB family)